jgi:multidrug efflux pump
LPNDFFTQSVIVAKDVAARERLREKLIKFLAEDFPSAITRVSPLELGPPIGWPVQYRVRPTRPRPVSIQIVKNHDQPFLVVAG